MEEIRRLYLQVGEMVIHLRHPEWGTGEVVEEMNSTVPGGMSMVKISFRDGKRRVFNNNTDSEYCCYYAGVRRHRSM
ncbi:MAG: DUF3553 domain-containing protein [Deltaproteobacteria bacterium]|nr:DUF3553 domain-containing protein [Deltaproteobacteria bacterium]